MTTHRVDAAGARDEPPRLLSGLEVFSLEHNVVLFHEASRRYFLLNPVAARVHAAMARGLSPEDAAREIVDQSGLSQDGLSRGGLSQGELSLDAAREAVARTLRDWEAGGLVIRGREATVPVAMANRHDAAPPEPPAPETGVVREHLVAGRRIALELHDAMLTRNVDLLLGPCRARTPGVPDIRLTAWPAPSGFVLREPGREDATTADAEAMFFLILQRLVALGCGEAPLTAVLHAGAVAVGEDACVLAGPSGSGKSTLAARLSAEGFVLVNDDTVLLQGAACRLRSLPLGIKLREGSWPLLEGTFPGLASIAPAGVTRERVKILPPAPLSAAALRRGFVARRLVFLERLSATTPAWEPLSPSEAFVRLIRSGSWIVPRREAMAAALRWIEGTPALLLRHATLDQAVDLMRRLAAS